MDPCPCGNPWVDTPDHGGLRCEGGSHFKTYTAAKAFINPAVPSASAANGPPSPAEVKNLLAQLERLVSCSGGFAWADSPHDGGFRCKGGSHFKNYAVAIITTSARASVAATPLRHDMGGLLMKLDPCPGGGAWVNRPVERVFRCVCGSRFKSYEEAMAWVAY